MMICSRWGLRAEECRPVVARFLINLRNLSSFHFLASADACTSIPRLSESSRDRPLSGVICKLCNIQDCQSTKGPTRGRMARLLDDLQARGDLVVSVDDAAEQSTLSRIAVQRQLERLAPRATRLPGRPSAFLIVPPEHRLRGGPPVAGQRRVKV